MRTVWHSLVWKEWHEHKWKLVIFVLLALLLGDGEIGRRQRDGKRVNGTTLVIVDDQLSGLGKLCSIQ